MNKKFKKALTNAYNFPKPSRKEEFLNSLERSKTERYYFRSIIYLRYMAVVFSALICLNVYNYYDGFFKYYEEFFAPEPSSETQYDENYQTHPDIKPDISEPETSIQNPDNTQVPEHNITPTEVNSKDIISEDTKSQNQNQESTSNSTGNAVRVPKITTAPRQPTVPVTGNVNTVVTKPPAPQPTNKPVTQPANNPTNNPVTRPPKPQIDMGRPVTKVTNSEQDVNIQTVPRTEPAPSHDDDPNSNYNEPTDNPYHEPSYDPQPPISPSTMPPIHPCPTDPPVTTTTIVTDIKQEDAL